MKPNEMTLAEFLAFNGKGGAKGLEEYKRLTTRKHWLIGRMSGQYMRMLDEQDSMSVFGEDEHDDPLYLKYQQRHLQSMVKAQRYEAQLNDIEEQLIQYMKQ